MSKGCLCLVLHSHLPYVYHPEAEDHLEEKWFFEALTECYIPLLRVMEGWVQDGINFRLSLSLSSPLITMLTNTSLQERYCRHLEKLIELSDKEIKRTKDQPAFNCLALYYKNCFQQTLHYFKDIKGKNLLPTFRDLSENEKSGLELFTSCGTHPYLPLVKNEETVRVHIKSAVDLFYRNLGRYPEGMWLPECGYRAGIENYLSKFDLKYFFLDTHAFFYASPKPRHGVFAPVYTGSGAAAFGRDPESSQQVWSVQQGYPGDLTYREYYRDIGFDLDYEYIKDYLPEGIRKNTGIKYYRITGKGDFKEPYDPEAAREKAAQHAANFKFNREKQVEYLSGQMDRPPVVTAPYDAELFGHWWYEGPVWLDYLVRKIHDSQNIIELTDPVNYLRDYPPEQEVKFYLSSWGEGGYNQVWLNQKNDWIYRHLHKAEDRMVELAENNVRSFGRCRQALNQAARELMLAQSSDWSFIMHTGTAVEYAVNRTKEHLVKFNKLYHMIQDRNVDESWLDKVRREDFLFPEMDYRLFCRQDLPVRKEKIKLLQKPGPPRILMLSWEFPPHMVGGLARHVYDLSQALAVQDINIHVLTHHADGTGEQYQNVNGVHVHRAATYQFGDLSFDSWVLQLNLIFFQYACRLSSEIGGFHLIHAHDWLVSYGAAALKNRLGVPLLATIHATEYGRNRGIHTAQQRYIHEVEWWLTFEAWKVICCSAYMREELKNIFNLPEDKIRVIPNGVNPANLKPDPFPEKWKLKYAGPSEKIVLFVGRLVKEKGVQTLLEAVPHIVREYPSVKFVIAGKGPYEDELKKKAADSGIEKQVVFAGFVSDKDLKRLYACADASVFPSFYEPFGIVAIEAMAAKSPVVVGDTGGFAETVEHEKDGLKFTPGNVRDLSRCLIRILKDDKFAGNLCFNAWQKVNSKYNWHYIARQTAGVYHEIFEDNKQLIQSTLEVENNIGCNSKKSS